MNRAALSIILASTLVSLTAGAEVNALSCTWRGASRSLELDQMTFEGELKPPVVALPEAKNLQPGVVVPVVINSPHTYEVQKTSNSAVQAFLGTTKQNEGSLGNKLEKNCKDAIDNCLKFFREGLKCELLLQTVDFQGVRIFLDKAGQTKSKAANFGTACNTLQARGLEWVKSLSGVLKKKSTGTNWRQIQLTTEPIPAAAPAVR